MSFTFAKELASKEADERMQELEITPEARAILYRMAYAVNQGAFMRSKGEYTTTHPLGTARLMKETFLSEYRVNKAKTELRSKNLASWTVNRVPVAGKSKIGKDGQEKQVYEQNEYTIHRTGLGITWEPNKWGEQEEDSEPAGEQEIAQPSHSDSSAIAVPVSEDDDAGQILALCLSYCKQKSLSAEGQQHHRGKINKYLEGGLTADLILSTIPEYMEREHWIKKIDNAKSSQIGLMITCIQDMADEAGRRRFLHGKQKPKSEDFTFVNSWQEYDGTWSVEIARGAEKRFFSFTNWNGHIPTQEEIRDYMLTDLQNDPSKWEEDGSPDFR
jgi:hypothetical protein